MPYSIVRQVHTTDLPSLSMHTGETRLTWYYNLFICWDILIHRRKAMVGEKTERSQKETTWVRIDVVDNYIFYWLTFFLFLRYSLWHKRTLTRDTAEVSCFLERLGQLSWSYELNLHICSPSGRRWLQIQVSHNTLEFPNHLATGWGCKESNCSFHCLCRTWPERALQKKTTWPGHAGG